LAKQRLHGGGAFRLRTLTSGTTELGSVGGPDALDELAVVAGREIVKETFALAEVSDSSDPGRVAQGFPAF